MIKRVGMSEYIGNVCTGHWVMSEHDMLESQDGSLMHDEFTYCPVHDARGDLPSLQRQSWDHYFLDIAKVVATRSTCKRLQVGAVLVRDNQIISTGYNGSISGAPHCIDSECLMEEGHCARSLHADTNAILFAAHQGVATHFTTMYLTHNPCRSCYLNMCQAGVQDICYGKLYRPVNYQDYVGQTFRMPRQIDT